MLHAFNGTDSETCGGVRDGRREAVNADLHLRGS